MSALGNKPLATSTASYDTSLISASAAFDGSSDYLSLSTGSSSGALSEFWAGAWVLKTDFANEGYIWTSTVSGGAWIQLTNTDTIQIVAGGFGASTTAVYRDAGWYHVVYHFSGTSSKLYVNGVDTSIPNGDGVGAFPSTVNNDSITFYLGRNSGAQRLHGYLAQPFYIEGSLTGGINDLGEFYTIGTNGSVWIPKADADVVALASSGGGNSFCLTGGIATGVDASTNSNSFTATGSPISSTNTPSLVEPVLDITESAAGGTSSARRLGTFQDGGLTLASGTGVHGNATFKMSPAQGGKFSFKAQVNGAIGGSAAIGVLRSDAPGDFTNGTNFNVVYWNDGDRQIDDTRDNLIWTAWTSANDIECVIDFDSNEVTFYRDGVSQGAESYTFDADYTYSAAIYLNSVTNGMTITFAGYTPQASALLMNSANMTAPTYQGADFFNAVTYAGNDADQSKTGAGFQPDLVWTKGRTGTTTEHLLFDVLRSPELGDTNITITTNEEGFTTSMGVIPTSDGFDFDTDVGGSNNPNTSAGWTTAISWLWAANGAGVANSVGSINSTVSVSPADNFSIVRVNAAGTAANATIGHGLVGGEPEFIIGKRTDVARNWPAWFEGITAGNTMYLNGTGAQTASATTWNSATAMGTVTAGTFDVGSGDDANASGGSYIFYCFRSVPGVCKVGSYTGNNNADGPYVQCSFAPRWILIKNISSTGDWVIYDTVRSEFVNPTSDTLIANGSNAEPYSSVLVMDILSDGFKWRTGTYSQVNTANTYLFIAMADVAGGGVLPPVPGR